MISNKDIHDYCLERDLSVLTADGFEGAILGISDCIAHGYDPRVVYSIERCIDILVKDGMSHEEAIEYFYYNCNSAFVEGAPVFIHTEF
ncbi:hypothetical protein AB4571_01055 [Vibrio breoganii]|nr:hypothetical protein [Vibrio breoganii]